MDQDQQPGQGSVSPGATGTRLSSSGVGSAAPGANSTAGSPNASGQFATLQSYLTANQGQAAPLANTITQGIGKQYNALQDQNAATLSGIQGQVSSAATPQDTALLSQEAANPVSFAANPGNVQSFQKQLNDQYTGPTSAESTPSFTNQQNAINSAIATGTAQTGSEAGREQLLQQNEARPTTGVTALNSAILTQSPDYLGQVQNAYQPFSNLLTGLTSGASDINKQIAQNQSQAQAASATANKQIADQAAALNAGVGTAQANAQKAYDTYNAQVPVEQQTLAPISQEAALFSGQTGVGFGDVSNPFTNLQQLVNAPTAATVATPDQYKTASALAQLAGSNPLGINFDYSNPALAGTAPAVPNIPTLTPQQYAQNYVNSLLGQGTAAGVAFNGMVAPNTPLFDFAKYLQSVNPNAVRTIPQYVTIPGGGQIQSPFRGWEDLVRQASGS